MDEPIWITRASEVPFTQDEHLLIASRLPKGKAQGPDYVPNEVVTELN